MTYVEGLRQGAAATRRIAQKSILELLINLIEDHPDANNERLFKLWLDVVREDENYLIPALRHTFSNLNASLERGRRKSPNGRPRMTVAEQTAAAKKIATGILKIVLLDYVLPSGKALRNATFAECAKAGGWLAKVAKKGKPNQIVGNVLNEKQLQDLLA